MAAALQFPGASFAQVLENDSYRVAVLPSGSLDVENKAARRVARFSPDFAVLWRDEDPKYALSPEKSVAYRIPTWNARVKGETTHDLFAAGDLIRLSATSSKFEGGRTAWVFSDHPSFSFAAELQLPAGKGEPQINFRISARKAGWFSAGFMGAPEAARSEVTSLWQPLVWQERRFPERSYFSIESMCSVPATLFERAGATIGVAADPAEIPFRQPTYHNSRFGVLLRNPAGNAQPMIFAPVFGTPDSSVQPGTTYAFRLRLVVNGGDCVSTFEQLARGLYAFRDYRQNGTSSLNETLENMVDFAMNDKVCGWIAEQKGSDYSTDVPGAVKNVSALHPLSIALITDNEDIYRRRALPMTEYMLSRQKFLFAPVETIKGQSASPLMRGPAAEVSELAALHGMFQERSAIFRHHAVALYDQPRALNLNMVSEGASWQNSLAIFRLTHERAFLDKAIAGANHYIASRIEQPQEDFRDVHIESGGQFWTDFAPKWVDLLELHEETKDPRHLAAAVQGAKLFSTYIWMQPCVPAGDVVVNPGGRVGMHYTNRIRNPQPLRAPEQSVPAWRVAQVGLMPEASTTHAHNPAVFLAHHAPYYHRLGFLTGNSFFHDIARSAVVGRYANFPGYDSNGEYTTIYQRPDYPVRPWRELTYNNVFYNHVWPLIAVVMDFLVSDVYVKSGGQIDFPARYAQGYAFLQSKVYGDRPGTFHGYKGVRLWLPRKMLRTDTIQANYIAGYGNGNFYLALTNQSAETQEVKVTLNPDVIPVSMSRSYPVQLWIGNQRGKPTTLRKGEIKVTLPSHGIVAVVVEGLNISSQFQDRIFAPADPVPPPGGFSFQETPFGKLNAMLLSMSPSLTNAFVWLEATPREVKTATLHYREKGVDRTIVDSIYPFEFSLPLAPDQSSIEFSVSATDPKGEVLPSAPVVLKR